MLVIVGVTVKATRLLSTPLAVTAMFPVLVPVGTGTVMLVSLQLVGVASVTPPLVPKKVTLLLLPCVAPKFVPVIVTKVPIRPAVGLILAIVGVG